MIRLIEDAEVRSRMGQRAYEITIPAFTWRIAAQHLMEELEIDIPASEPT